MQKQIFLRSLLQAGLLAGTLDGLAAALVFFMRTGKDPLAVYRFVASGLFGRDAILGGTSMAMLGIGFHYVIAMSWAFLFFISCSKLKLLLKNWIVSGVVYGVFVWLIMNLIVLPLSRVSSAPMTVSGVFIGASVLMVCIGLPISFRANKYYSN